jgi:hypothetical protein
MTNLACEAAGLIGPRAMDKTEVPPSRADKFNVLPPGDSFWGGQCRKFPDGGLLEPWLAGRGLVSSY